MRPGWGGRRHRTYNRAIERATAVSKGLARDLLEVFVLALGLYLLATFSIQTVHVVGFSMYPTLDSGDLLLASKLDYRIHSPERGDIVILKDPLDPTKDFIKRVVGLPGDHVLIRDHHVLINGVTLTEPYVETWQATPNWPQQPDAIDGETVPPSSFFVLGDNRDHSSDSRVFGYIGRDQIDAKAVARFWPFAHADLLNLRPTLAKEP